MTSPLIQSRALSIGYPARCVGTDISLELFPREILCLLGPNGSGKSTLFKTLLGLLAPLKGEVLLYGKPVSKWGRRALAQRIAYVPQAHLPVFPFSVTEVVLMGRHAYRGALSAPSVQDRQQAQRCLADLGIESLSERRYTEISGGERQLVLIARALAQQAEILVMDEPTASLDFGNQIRVLEHIRRMRDRGLSIFLCTHQPEHALRVADRVALFKSGQLHYVGAPDQTLSVAKLSWLYDLDESALRTSVFQWLAPG